MYDTEDCTSCGGQGLIEIIDWMTGSPADVTCHRCNGSGEER